MNRETIQTNAIGCDNIIDDCHTKRFIVWYFSNRSAIINWICPEMSRKMNRFQPPIQPRFIIFFKLSLANKTSVPWKNDFARKNPSPVESVLNCWNLHLFEGENNVKHFISSYFPANPEIASSRRIYAPTNDNSVIHIHPALDAIQFIKSFHW